MRSLPSALLGLLVVVASTPEAGAHPVPAKPHHQLVDEVVAFLLSDVGVGGIRTEDAAPDGAPVPPYFYHYSIRHDDGLASAVGGYPGYASISYPGYTMAIAIDTFLGWWVYGGDPRGLARAIEAADWILDRRTPATDLYAHWPYSTQTDGVMGGGYDLDAVMSDKPGMMGTRYLRLFDITGDARYFDAATQIADTYVATQRSGAPEEDGRWPFRVRPSDGFVRQDYTSHLIPAIELLEQMEVRRPGFGYGASAARAWNWIENNPMNGASPDYMRWEGFYEDIGPESAGLRDHYSAEATAAAYLERGAPGDLEKAIEIRDWSTSVFLPPDGPQNGNGVYDWAILEWQAWMNTTYAATAQWGVLQLRLHDATFGTALHDPQWREQGLRALNNLTYGQAPASSVPSDDGRMLTTIRELTQAWFGIDTWYEQNFNTVLYLLEAFDLEPSLAPADEDHLLGYDGAEPTAVQIADGRITSSWSGAGTLRAKLASAPTAVTVQGVLSLEPGPVGDASWSYDPLMQVVEVQHQGGEVILDRNTGTPAPSAKEEHARLEAVPNPFNPRTRIQLELPRGEQVSVRILDARGRLVRTLFRGALEEGMHAWIWDGNDASGAAAASGNYRAVVRGAHVVLSTTVTLVR